MNKMKNIIKTPVFYVFTLLVLAGCIWSTEVQAQYGMQRAEVEYNENVVIKSLKSQYLAYYRNEKEISGWRILLSSTTSRRQMDDELAKFKKHYEGVPYKWDYEAPHYKLRAGAYLSRLEAKQALGKYKKHFSSAIEIQDKIKKEDFLK